MNRSITFCKLILATVTVLVVATPAGVMAQATDPESLINTCQDALRAGDVGQRWLFSPMTL
jgi:hypothetical protein